MAESNEALNELRKISKILLLAHASAIEKELEKIATSDARKKMWVLIDGKRMPKDIANELKITERAVHYFLNDLATAGFIENQRGEPPKRILDYVPPSWIELFGEPTEEGSKKPLVDSVEGRTVD